MQVSQEIDEYTVYLQNRRDTLSVADFEVRGDVGIPAADCVLAEELLPRFKNKFELVERAQVAKVLRELQLEASHLGDNDEHQREVGRLARVRYLVLGSVTRSGAWRSTLASLMCEPAWWCKPPRSPPARRRKSWPCCPS